jgi:hypothetical protein
LKVANMAQEIVFQIESFSSKGKSLRVSNSTKS